MDVKKAIDLTIKLLRKAAPNRGSTKSEMEIAALEAARLIAEHNLTVIETPAPVKKKRPQQHQQPATYNDNGYNYYPDAAYRSPKSSWFDSYAPHDVICALCGKIIRHGEPTWLNANYGHIHPDMICV